MVRPAVQAGQLRRWAGLMVDVFARAGSAWVFGFGSPGPTRWGVIRLDWRPGRLSNYFFFRLQRARFVARSGRVWSPRPARRRRRRRRLGGRLVRLVNRRVQRPRWDPRRVRRVRPTRMAAHAYARFTRAGRHGWAAPGRTPQWGRPRTRRFRRWWCYTTGLRPRRGRRGPGVGRAAARGGRFVLGRWARLRRRRRVRPTRRPTPRVDHPGWAVPAPIPPGGRGVRVRTRRVGRHARWAHPFPTVVLLGGVTLLKATLLNEVNATGVVLVRFGGIDFVPRAGPVEVYWNDSAASLDGLPGLLTDLHTRAVRTGLFRTCWRRLARLAKR